ncbi:MAG: sulfite exporter TauE/SafE family protein [Nitriliruptoraceae bacterium]
MLEVLGVALPAVGLVGLVAVAVAAVLGGAAQSTAGFGAAFVTVPALAVVAPELLPGAMLVAALPLSIVMAVTGWAHLDRAAALRLMLGRVPGIALGTAIVAVADVRWVTALIAVVLLGAVGAAAAGTHLMVTPRRELIAGVVSGVTGTAAALGGPPIALLYRGREPHVVRPTLGVVWAVGIVLALPGLWLTGSFDATQAVVGAVLGAFVLLGLAASRGVVRRLSVARVRTFVLVWAFVGGLAALLRVLLA